MPTTKVTLVAAALGQRLNTNREWEASGHTLMLGEYKANINHFCTLRLLRSGAVENENGNTAATQKGPTSSKHGDIVKQSQKKDAKQEDASNAASSFINGQRSSSKFANIVEEHLRRAAGGWF